MDNILEFPVSRRREASRSVIEPLPHPAEIVIFSGIRYERRGRPHPPACEPSVQDGGRGSK
jgi:hypothetical protein